MCHGVESPHVVVDDHARGVHPRADAVVEHQRHTHVEQLLEVLVVLRVLGLRDDDAAHLVLVERLADVHLAVVLLVALRHHDGIAARRRFLLDAAQHRGKIEVGKLRDDDADDFLRPDARMAQRLGHIVRREVVLLRILLDALALRLADARRVLQRSRHRSHGNAQFPCDVLHRDRRSITHVFFLSGCRL